jgi:tetratricopeptide (TPR) repeat protein
MALFKRDALKSKYLPLLLIALCTLSVYWNTLHNGFVYDDYLQILGNKWITNTKYFLDIFSHDATLAESGDDSNYYRPMMHLIYMAIYHAFGGLKPWAFHLVNVLSHLGVAILVFFTTALILPDAKSTTSRQLFSIPFVAALIFAVHPINTEVVAWVACIPELSYTFFCLLAAYAHMRSTHDFDLNHLGSLAFFGIAIFCKETAVTILPLLVLYDYIYRTDRWGVRRCITRYAPFALLVAAYLFLRYNALEGLAPSNQHLELTTYELIINILPLFVQYVGKLLLPVNLKAYYVLNPVHSITDPTWLLSLIAIIVFILIGIILYKKNKAAFLGLMIITIPLLPVMYIRGLGESTFAERYLYLPSIGFSLAAGILFNSIITNKDRLRVPLSIFLVSVLVVYSIITVNRNKVWHDELTLWGETVKRSADSSLVHYNLGVALSSKGDLDAAIKEYKAAIVINPAYTDAHTNLGIACLSKDEVDAAIEAFAESHTIRPTYAEVHFNLGTALSRKGDLDAAIEEYKDALAIKPTYVEAHFNLGIAFSNKGDLGSAIKEFKEVLAINPSNAVAHFNLGIAFAGKGDLDAAIREFKEALAINPTNADVHNNLGIAFANKGNLEAAIMEFKEALAIRPNHALAQKNLKFALGSSK